MGCGGSKLKLSTEDLKFLIAHTHYSEDDIKIWFEKFCVECPDGRLFPARFVALYKKLFPGENAEAFCSHVFRTFDTDQNGYIDFKEFLFAIESVSAGSPEEKLRRAFQMYDVNGNGFICLEEMVKVMEAFCDMLESETSKNGTHNINNKFSLRRTARARAERIFRTLDHNKDGQVSEEEFMDGCLKDAEFSQVLQLEQNLNKAMLSLI